MTSNYINVDQPFLVDSAKCQYNDETITAEFMYVVRVEEACGTEPIDLLLQSHTTGSLRFIGSLVTRQHRSKETSSNPSKQKSTFEPNEGFQR